MYKYRGLKKSRLLAYSDKTRPHNNLHQKANLNPKEKNKGKNPSSRLSALMPYLPFFFGIINLLAPEFYI
jgi:hypothetical protein